jgi:hypothetical protein
VPDADRPGEFRGRDEAHNLCRAEGPDLCLVVIDDRVVEAAPHGEIEAPGRDRDIPALMLVGTVTLYLRRLAREYGHFSAAPATITLRMLCRRMSAALQHRQTPEAARPRVPSTSAGTPPDGGRNGRIAQTDAALALFRPHLRC